VEGHARDRLRDRRPSAPGKGGHEARRIEPEGITLAERGKGANKKINNIVMENEDYCDSP
jgi:5-deoxy-glucuronate isomerase